MKKTEVQEGSRPRGERYSPASFLLCSGGRARCPLNMVPSRLVALLDETENRALIERRANPDDRRSYAVHTEIGRSILRAIGVIAREHSQVLLAALSDDERQQLASLLQRVAAPLGFTPGVHPSYCSE